MSETVAPAILKPIWIDLATSDPAAARDFYSALFGWEIAVNPDPQYGGYAQATIGGKSVAGIGGKMMPEAPTTWSMYVGTADIADLAARVQAAGGTVIAPPMQVGDQGTMAVFQDPAGAFISAWQPAMMEGGLMGAGAGTYGWAELNSRDLDKVLGFYTSVFAWDAKAATMGDGGPRYIEFRAGDTPIGGAMDMNPMVPPEVPSYWLLYFTVDDVDASYAKAISGGAREMLPPADFAGGRFAILGDPQGAAFGLLKMTRA
jgi:predicted enzyme related to lactoylglutathione lyase